MAVSASFISGWSTGATGFVTIRVLDNKGFGGATMYLLKAFDTLNHYLLLQNSMHMVFNMTL